MRRKEDTLSRSQFITRRAAVLGLPALVLACGSGSVHGATANALPQWSAGGVRGKKICFVGDSTTSNATALFAELRGRYSAVGAALNGVGPILNFGENGASLYAFMRDQVSYGLTRAIAERPNLYVLCYGINDVRLGTTTGEQLFRMLVDTVDRIRREVPTADIVLRMPNSLLSADVNNSGLVRPNDAAQKYSTTLRNAYLRVENRWPNVAMLNSQALVFGTQSLPSSPLMFDQLHPSNEGNTALAKALVALIAPGVASADVPIPLAAPALLGGLIAALGVRRQRARA